MNQLHPKLPITHPRRGFFPVAVASLLFALAFLPAPLAVLYELNDECLVATSWGTAHATWDTLHHVPPSPVPRHLPLLVRTAVIGGLLSALFLLVAAGVTFRSRAGAVRFHAIYVALQLVLMTTLVVAAHRFSTAFDATRVHREWAMRVIGPSTVRNLALAVAGLGLFYPLVLALLYWRYPDEEKKTRMEDGR